MKHSHLAVVAFALLSAPAFAGVAGTGIGQSSSLKDLAEKHPKFDLRTLITMAEEEACVLAHQDLIADLAQKCVRILNEENTRYVDLKDRKTEDCTYSPSANGDIITASRTGTADCQSNRQRE